VRPQLTQLASRAVACRRQPYASAIYSTHPSNDNAGGGNLDNTGQQDASDALLQELGKMTMCLSDNLDKQQYCNKLGCKMALIVRMPVVFLVSFHYSLGAKYAQECNLIKPMPALHHLLII
jgi:hypothetical protein